MNSKKTTPAFYISVVTGIIAFGCVALLISMATDPRRQERPTCTIVPEYVRCPYSPEAFSLPEEVPPDNGDITLEDSITSLSMAGVSDAINGKPDSLVQRKPQGRSFPLLADAIDDDISSPTSPIVSKSENRDPSLSSTMTEFIRMMFEDSDP